MKKRFSFNIKNYFLRHLQSMLFSLGRLWRQPFSTFLTIGVIGIALALPAGLFVLLQNINNVSNQWDDASQISLFLKQDLQEKQIKQLNNYISSWPQITESNYQTAEQSLDEFRELSGLGHLLDTLPDNPLPPVITLYPQNENLSADDIRALLEKLAALPEVVQAQLDMEWLQRLRSINKVLARGVSLLALLLSLSVVLVIGNTIRLAILNCQSEIKIMKLVGATNRFIRRPFLYTGFWYGLLGGFFAWCTLLFAMSMLASPINALTIQYASDYQLRWFAGALLLYLPLTGLFIGVLGAWIAVGRHLNSIEPN
jgi:cell division transport system permease protein